MARVIQGITFGKAGLRRRQKKLLRKRLKNLDDAGYPKQPVKLQKTVRTFKKAVYWMDTFKWTKTLTEWNIFWNGLDDDAKLEFVASHRA